MTDKPNTTYYDHRDRIDHRAAAYGELLNAVELAHDADLSNADRWYHSINYATIHALLAIADALVAKPSQETPNTTTSTDEAQTAQEYAPDNTRPKLNAQTKLTPLTHAEVHRILDTCHYGDRITVTRSYGGTITSTISGPALLDGLSNAVGIDLLNGESHILRKATDELFGIFIDVQVTPLTPSTTTNAEEV